MSLLACFSVTARVTVCAIFGRIESGAVRVERIELVAAD